MRRTHLNLTSIRESCASSQAPAAAHGVLSRRQALGVAGVAAVGVSPALKTLERFGTRIEVRGDAQRVAFLLDGKERWIVDTRRFAGTPHLSIEGARARIRVTLTGARYPGTDFWADLIAELQQGMLSPRITIQMSLGHFPAEVAPRSSSRAWPRSDQQWCLGGIQNGSQQVQPSRWVDVPSPSTGQTGPFASKGRTLVYHHAYRQMLSVVDHCVARPDHPSVFLRVPHSEAA